MSPNVERLLTVLVTAAVASAANWAGYGEAGRGSEAKAAMDQCCPIARECVEGLIGGH